MLNACAQAHAFATLTLWKWWYSRQWYSTILNFSTFLGPFRPNFGSKIKFPSNNLCKYTFSRLELNYFRLELNFLWLDLIEIFGFKVGHFFRRDGAADPRWLGVRGQRPPRGRKIFCILHFRGGPLRQSEVQNGSTLDPKNFPNWAGINFFWLDLNFFGWI